MSYRSFSNLCFLLFAAMLLSSLLISIVAAARSFRRRAKTGGTKLTSASTSPVRGRWPDVLLLIAAAATCANISPGGCPAVSADRPSADGDHSRHPALD